MFFNEVAHLNEEINCNESFPQLVFPSAAFWDFMGGTKY
jgi:hypothetical protein